MSTSRPRSNTTSNILGRVSSGTAAVAPGKRDSNEPQFALPGDPASASRGGRTQFGASGRRTPLFKNRTTNKFSFGGGGGAVSSNSMHPPPPSQHQFPSHPSPSSCQNEHEQLLRSSVASPAKKSKQKHHYEEEQQPEEEEEEEEEMIVLQGEDDETIVEKGFNERNGGRGGAGDQSNSHHHHHHEQDDPQLESPPLSSPSRYHGRATSDYVDDEDVEILEQDDHREGRGRGGYGDDETEEDDYDRETRLWTKQEPQEPELDHEHEHEQDQEEVEREVVEQDDERASRGRSEKGSRVKVRFVPTGLPPFEPADGRFRSPVPDSLFQYLEISQSDLYAERHKAFDEKWGAVDADDEQKWVEGGNDLVEKAKGVLDRVKEHVIDRMKLYNKIDAQIVEHKGELVENATTLDKTANQLSSWGHHIVTSVNVGGAGSGSEGK